ncbi:MAG: hypothetical protein ABW157_12465 [Candidatus Thiodiazotropha sp. LLP2]
MLQFSITHNGDTTLFDAYSGDTLLGGLNVGSIVISYTLNVTDYVN